MYLYSGKPKTLSPFTYPALNLAKFGCSGKLLLKHKQACVDATLTNSSFTTVQEYYQEGQTTQWMHFALPGVPTTHVYTGQSHL